mmetsp:Transcript_15109/g.40900  ORF Transcript_15109/g.40900 Transcript_15109/m.40900 type:complete len:105 (-) Transcript_15109:472-786(-)
MDSISLPLFYSLTVCASQQQATATNHLQLTHAFNRRIAARTHTLARVHTHTHTHTHREGMHAAPTAKPLQSGQEGKHAGSNTQACASGTIPGPQVSLQTSLIKM